MNNSGCSKKRTSYCNYSSTTTPTIASLNSESNTSKNYKRSDYTNKIELFLNNQNIHNSLNRTKISLDLQPQDQTSTISGCESSKRTDSNRFGQYKTEYNSAKQQFIIKRLVSTSNSSNQSELNSKETITSEPNVQKDQTRSSTALLIISNKSSTQPAHRKAELFKVK